MKNRIWKTISGRSDQSPWLGWLMERCAIEFYIIMITSRNRGTRLHMDWGGNWGFIDGFHIRNLNPFSCFLFLVLYTRNEHVDLCWLWISFLPKDLAGRPA